MLLKVVTAVLLALLIQYIEGFHRIIVVIESEDDSLIHQDKTFTRAMRSGMYSTFRDSCCIDGNCSCQSLYNALANLTSNVLINITTDVELSSIIQRVNLANVTITGYNNPTVNCNNSGGLHFISCTNCTIKGIGWKRCGYRNISDDGNAYPVLHLTNSFNITIHSCSFQHSIGQAVALSGVLRDVSIKYCSFSYAKKYEGHGTSIHYSSNNKLIVSPFNITVSNCNFLYNERAKSIVYFGQRSNKHCEVLNLRDSKFCHNKGVPIYLSNQNLCISGNVKFCNNSAENGGGIFASDHSNVIFHKSGTVKFTNNAAQTNGGAIFLTNQSSILFKSHSRLYQNQVIYSDQIQANSFMTCTILFFNNTANGLGQDIYAHNSSLTIDDNTRVRFDSITIQHSSGAVYIDDHSTFIFKGDSIVTFSDYIGVNGNGGTLYIDSSTTTFEGNSTVTFKENHADNGGALYIDNSNIIFKGNSKVTLNSNDADKGGALYTDNSSIIFEEESIITFSTCWSINGGALYIDSSVIRFKENSTVAFINNAGISGLTNGGAVYIHDYSIITFEGNSTVTFNTNRADNGGALYIDNSHIIFKGNSKVTFNNNIADKGGEVYIILLLYYYI